MRNLSGVKIRDRRMAQGLSQTALGRLVGTTGVTVSRWETGSRRPKSPDLVGHLAHKLGCKVDDLYA